MTLATSRRGFLGGIFGRGRISALMADIGGGFKNLRQGMRELEHDS